jgi:hypothetical protein
MRKTKARAAPLVLNTKPDPKYHVSINSIRAPRPWPGAEWDHWKVFGIKPTTNRSKVIERYHKIAKTGDLWEIDIAYGRIIGELWAKGVYHRDFPDRDRQLLNETLGIRR